MLEFNKKEEKTKIIVPQGIRFISDWTDYSLNDFQFPHILDKKIPGCGYTEYCIRCSIPVILCSPRLMLLENKTNQHPEVFYYNNELEEELDTGKDLNKILKPKKEDNSKELTKKELEDELRKEFLKELKTNLLSYISDCVVINKAPKILVTYDSFRHVKESLTEIGFFDQFHVVIDEFQSIFTDSRFKSTTELEFIYQLQGVSKVCFVSATPMMDSYMKNLDEFRDLPFFELDWETRDPGRAIKPDLKVRISRSISSVSKDIINSYKLGNYEKFTWKDEEGNIQTIESREAVFYVNSVSSILSIIKDNELKSEEVNILCANTNDNRKKIKNKLGSSFKIGEIPLKGQPHKMFTFCTRTVYLGADFYSTNARTFILSDANINSLAVDISLDLPQILGRQRLLENPWKNRAEFYYRTLSDGKEMTKEDFDNFVNNKKKSSQNLLVAYNSSPKEAKHDLALKYKRDAISSSYKFDYIAVNTHAGKDLVPVLNNLVIVAEQRAFDIQQIDYKDRFTVFNTIQDNGMINDETVDSIKKFFSEFKSLDNFYSKMKLICEFPLSTVERGVILDQIPLSFKNYYLTLGPERCRALSYNSTWIKKEFNNIQFDKTTLRGRILSVFKVGERYSKSYLKEALSTLYESLGYNVTAKAVDIKEYFVTKETLVFNKETGKQDKAFKLVCLKEEFKYI